MPQNIIKILDKNFSDLKAGEKMYISSPEIITKYIEKIPFGVQKSLKEVRLELAKKVKADNTCPVTTGIFLRKSIQMYFEKYKKYDKVFPFWRIISEKHPIVKKLNLNVNKITNLRKKEKLINL